MQLVAPGVTWFEDLKVLISWKPTSKHVMFFDIRSYSVMCDLLLVPHASDSHVLCVQKNRYMCVSHHAAKLDQIFQEYELDTKPWRGQVKLSESEYVRWQLMLS